MIIIVALLLGNLLMLIILFYLKKLNQVIKLLYLALVIELELLITAILLAMVTPNIGPEKHFLLILC